MITTRIKGHFRFSGARFPPEKSLDHQMPKTLSGGRGRGLQGLAIGFRLALYLARAAKKQSEQGEAS